MVEYGKIKNGYKNLKKGKKSYVFCGQKKIEDTVKFVEDLVSMFEGHQQWESDVEKSVGADCPIVD